MLKFIRAHKKILIDFIYSFVAYGLPTVVLQFVIQPLIAGRTTADANGLFVTLFNVVKLMAGVFIVPLANLRLLKKQECEKNIALNSFFNTLFIVAISCSAIIGTLMNGFYRNFKWTVTDIILLLLILLIMGVHDYFMIVFRLILNYKKIVIDNILIVSGYGIGLLLFIYTGLWELIFITGYLFGMIYVLFSTDLWKPRPGTKDGSHLVRQYGDLCASDLLKNATTYCDRLIIYPVLGGYDVSVYNSASVVSKAVTVISSPLRNVLLSYIVNSNELKVSRKKLKKYIPLAVVGIAVVFAVFWGVSILACKLLYPKYAASAMPFIPIITIAIVIETTGAILNIVLFRFARTVVQTIISALKLGVYLVAVLLLAIVAKMGLLGFCIAILLADITFITAVLVGLSKNITLTE